MKRRSLLRALYLLLAALEVVLLAVLWIYPRYESSRPAAPRAMTSRELEETKAYGQVDLSAAEVLAQSDVVETSSDYTTYTSQTLPQALYQCETLREISEIGEAVYVSYLTPGGEEVILTILQERLGAISRYVPASDSYYSMTNTGDGWRAEKYENFRDGWDSTPVAAAAIALGVVLLAAPLIARKRPKNSE